MIDTQENVENLEVAPQESDAQSEQATAADDAVESPEEAPTDKDEKILGKFNSVEDLAKSYQELESKYTKASQTRSETDREQAPVDTGYQPSAASMANTAFDDETQSALDQWYAQRRESEKAAEFVRANADKLSDPLLAGATKQIIAEENRAGRSIDQQEALKRAEALLEERLTPRTKEAAKSAFDEGQSIAREKQRQGAVGEVGKVPSEKDDSQLSSDEYAAKYKIPRVE